MTPPPSLPLLPGSSRASLLLFTTSVKDLRAAGAGLQRPITGLQRPLRAGPLLLALLLRDWSPVIALLALLLLFTTSFKELRAAGAGA